MNGFAEQWLSSRVQRKTKMRIAILGTVLVAVVFGVRMFVAEPAGVTATPRGSTAAAAATSSDLDASRADAAALDEYADELGLVMVRSRGPEPEVYARMVDGPGPDVETLSLDVSDGAAHVVLRLRQDRQDCGWLAGSSCRPYKVSACYRWTFDDSMEEHEPDRLDACPKGPVLELGPAPVEPQLPNNLAQYLRDNVVPPSDVSEQTALAAVRALYAEAVSAALESPEVKPDHLLGVDDALAPDSTARAGDSVGVAVGRGTECVMVRMTPREVRVWVPDRISLMPGEIGCHAAGQMARR